MLFGMLFGRYPVYRPYRPGGLHTNLVTAFGMDLVPVLPTEYAAASCAILPAKSRVSVWGILYGIEKV